MLSVGAKLVINAFAELNTLFMLFRFVSLGCNVDTVVANDVPFKLMVGAEIVPVNVAPVKLALPVSVLVSDVCMSPYNKSPVSLASPFICSEEPVIPPLAVNEFAVIDEPLFNGAKLDNFVDRLKPPAYNKSVHVMLLLTTT